jgi:hypothetical protein
MENNQLAQSEVMEMADVNFDESSDDEWNKVGQSDLLKSQLARQKEEETAQKSGKKDYNPFAEDSKLIDEAKQVPTCTAMVNPFDSSVMVQDKSVVVETAPSKNTSLLGPNQLEAPLEESKKNSEEPKKENKEVNLDDTLLLDTFAETPPRHLSRPSEVRKTGISQSQELQDLMAENDEQEMSTTSKEGSYFVAEESLASLDELRKDRKKREAAMKDIKIKIVQVDSVREDNILPLQAFRIAVSYKGKEIVKLSRR